MANFDHSFQKTVIGHEGLYSKHPDDPGGETLWGISRVHHPRLHLWIYLDSFRSDPKFPQCLGDNPTVMSLVKDFYRDIYWDVMLGDLVSSQMIANEMFDTAINLSAGVQRAVSWCQRACNVLNRNQRLWPDIVEDGVMGQITIDAIAALVKFRRVEGERCACKIMDTLQGMHYLTVLAQHPVREEFALGWFSKRIGNERS